MHKHMVGLHPIMDPVHLGYYRRAMGFRSRVKKKQKKVRFASLLVILNDQNKKK